MSIKIISSVLILLLCNTMLTHAQEWPSTNEIMSRVQSEMVLDQVQLAKVKRIVEANIAERLQVKPEAAQGMTQAESQQFETKLYEQLRDVLTRSQLNQWNALLSVLLQETYAK